MTFNWIFLSISPVHNAVPTQNFIELDRTEFEHVEALQLVMHTGLISALPICFLTRIIYRPNFTASLELPISRPQVNIRKSLYKPGLRDRMQTTGDTQLWHPNCWTKPPATAASPYSKPTSLLWRTELMMAPFETHAAVWQWRHNCYSLVPDDFHFHPYSLDIRKGISATCMYSSLAYIVYASFKLKLTSAEVISFSLYL